VSETGRRTENEVADLCGTLFLRDFVLASPKFRTGSGQQREVADALLPCGSSLIALQVKTRTIKGHTIEDGSPELARIMTRVEKAAKQVKTVKRALSSGTLEPATTLRGVEVPFGTRDFDKIVGLVIFDVFGSNGESIVDQVEFMGYALARVHDIPVHIMRACDFAVIAEEQDTLPDLLNYLDTRAALLSADILFPLLSELDLFAVFKVRYQDIKASLASNRMLPIRPGFWESVRKAHGKIWAERDERMLPSYVVDRTIEQVHTCIGYNPSVEDSEEPAADQYRGRAAGGTEYWELIHKLGMLTRIERAQFGEKMISAARRADTEDYASTLIYRPPDVGPIVYLCSNKPRHERTKALQLRMKLACARMGTSHAVGVCNNSYSSIERAHDFAAIEGITSSDRETLRKLAEQIYQGGESTSLDEWGTDYAQDA